MMELYGGELAYVYKDEFAPKDQRLKALYIDYKDVKLPRITRNLIYSPVTAFIGKNNLYNGTTIPQNPEQCVFTIMSHKNTQSLPVPMQECAGQA